MSSWAARKLAEGLCPNCGTAPRGVRVRLCDVCRGKQNAKVAERRQACIAAGVCVECTTPVTTTRYYCDGCQAYRNEKKRIARREKSGHASHGAEDSTVDRGAGNPERSGSIPERSLYDASSDSLEIAS